MQVMTGDFAACKKPHQGDVAQRMGDQGHFGIGTPKVGASAACAAHVDGAHGAAVRVFSGIELLPDFGAHPNQVLAGRRHIALAERQLHTGADRFAQGHTLARRVQSDQVARRG